MEDHVYVIGTPGSSVVKIGVTNSLERRIRQIQTMSPVPLQLLWSCVGSIALEAALHREFADLRTHGEWFDFGDSDPVATIREVVPKLKVVEGKASQTRKRRAASTKAAARARYMPVYGPGTIFKRDPTLTEVEGWPSLDHQVPYYRQEKDWVDGEIRCWCGHQPGSHDSIRPHACGGDCNDTGMWSECLCLGYEGPLPSNLEGYDLPGHNWRLWRQT